MDWKEWALWLIEEIAKHWILHGLWMLVGGGGLVLGVLMFGRRYKQRIKALEDNAKTPTVVVNVGQSAADSDDVIARKVYGIWVQRQAEAVARYWSEQFKKEDKEDK